MTYPGKITVLSVAFTFGAWFPTCAFADDDGWAKLFFRIPLSDGDQNRGGEPHLGFATGIGKLRYEIPFSGQDADDGADGLDSLAEGRVAPSALDVSLPAERLTTLKLNGISTVDLAKPPLAAH